MTPSPTVNVQLVEELIALGLTVFEQIFSLFHTQNVPITAAPALTAQLQATPGLTPDHKAVIATAVQQAVAAHTSSV